MPRTRPPYPPEFKAEAIRLVKTQGDPLSQIAKDLGVSDQTLRNWVKQDDVDAGRKSGLTSDERPRLRELERENRKLREEREILRKPGPSSRARPGGGRRGASRLLLHARRQRVRSCRARHVHCAPLIRLVCSASLPIVCAQLGKEEGK